MPHKRVGVDQSGWTQNEMDTRCMSSVQGRRKTVSWPSQSGPEQVKWDCPRRLSSARVGNRRYPLPVCNLRRSCESCVDSSDANADLTCAGQLIWIYFAYRRSATQLWWIKSNCLCWLYEPNPGGSVVAQAEDEDMQGKYQQFCANRVADLKLSVREASHEVLIKGRLL